MSASNKQLPELTHRELEIIKILWQLKKASLREVHKELARQRDVAYPTTKTVLDRMAEKGYLKRENVHGILVYRALISKPSGIAMMVKNFMQNVLEIDESAVASLFANSNVLTQEELDELKELLKTSKQEDEK